MDNPSTFAKSDARKAGAEAVTAEDYLIAVFKESALLFRGQRDRFGPAPSQLQKTAARLFLRTRDRAAGDEIARTEIAAVARMVRKHLRRSPVHVLEAALAEPDGPHSPAEHCRRR